MILVFDTSSPRTSIAVGEPEAETPAAAFSEVTGGANQASAWLHKKLAEVVAEAGASMDDVTLVAVGRGPGTFTGSRVAVATAKGLCLGLGCPALPLSTLSAVGSASGARSTVALLDARRGDVYALLLERDDDGWVHGAGEETCEPIESVLKRAPSEATLVGPGVTAYRERIEAWRIAHANGFALRESDGVTVDGLWAAARAAASRGEAVDAGTVEVEYLRESYAQMGLNVPKRPVTRSPFLDS